jgi:hypothetical protein
LEACKVNVPAAAAAADDSAGAARALGCRRESANPARVYMPQGPKYISKG